MPNTMAWIVTAMLLAAGGAQAKLSGTGPAMDLLNNIAADRSAVLVPVALSIPGRSVFASLNDAVKAGDASAVLSIIRNPASDVNTPDGAGMTPLMNAVMHQDARIVELLLAHPRIEINARDRRRVTATMLAASYSSIAVLDLLLAKRGNNLNMKDEEGKTALMYAAYSDNGAAISRLLGKEANADLRNNDGATALEIAKLFGHRSALNALS